MTGKSWCVLWLVLMLVSPQLGRAKTMRAGLFVGSNQGNTGEKDLSYANEDALKMQVVFQRYGGLSQQLSTLVRDADREAIRKQIRALDERIEAGRKRATTVECIVYFSGHGGMDGLHLEGDIYPYRQLYNDMRRLRCDLLVVILDACHSGEFLNVKGITPIDEEFRVRIYDTRKGEVFITSSADTEYAQEKDELKGSVFTHFFANGLLGAADVNRDGRVTLSEAYNHASAMSVRETFGSARGFQVPSYRYEVEGSQDPVLTELNGKKEAIVLPEGIEGVVTFMDTRAGVIWGDFEVDPQRRRVFVPHGDYLVRVRNREGRLLLSRCRVSRAQPVRFEPLQEVPEDEDPMKGGRVRHPWELRLTTSMRYAPGRSLERAVGYGGMLAVLLENVVSPSLYGGVGLGMFGGGNRETLFGSPITHAWLMSSVQGVLGAAEEVTSALSVSAELKAGAGYAWLTTRLPERERRAGGAFVELTMQGQTAWRLSRDVALVFPVLYASVLVFREYGALARAWDIGAGAGFELRY